MDSGTFTESAICQSRCQTVELGLGQGFSPLPLRMPKSTVEGPGQLTFYIAAQTGYAGFDFPPSDPVALQFRSLVPHLLGSQQFPGQGGETPSLLGQPHNQVPVVDLLGGSPGR